MIRISNLNFFKLLVFVSLNILYVIAFYTIFGLDTSSQNYSFIHAMMSGVLITQLSNILKKREKLSLGFLLIYVFCMYFQFSIIKYCRRDAFYGFSTDNNVRFQGTVIVFLTLLVVNNVQIIKRKKNEFTHFSIEKRQTGSKLWAWMISMLLLTYYIFIYDYSNSIYIHTSYQPQSKLADIVLNVVVTISVYLAVVCLDIYRPISYLPLFLDIISFVYYAMKTGSRSDFFAYIFLTLFMLSENRIIKHRWFIIAQIAAPWFISVFTYITFMISGRYSSNFAKVVAMNVAYRFDLSDFAVSILNNTSWFRFNFSEIWSGIQNCIPSFVSVQFKGFASYYNMLSEAQLIPSVDYSDTFFSMGASAGGIIGMVSIVPMFYFIYENIDAQLNKCGKKGILIKMICILSLMRIEIEWTSFIPELRNLCLAILITLFAFRVISIKYYWKK